MEYTDTTYDETVGDIKGKYELALEDGYDKVTGQEIHAQGQVPTCVTGP